MSVPISSIEDELQTGDLVFFKSSTMGGALIRCWERTEFSHIGLVIRRPTDTVPLLFEATTNKAKLKDKMTGKTSDGVQLVTLRDKLFCGTYKLAGIKKLRAERTDEQLRSLDKFMAEVAGRAYEEDDLELFKAGYDGLFGENKTDAASLNTLFCSELVAEAYMRMGLLDRSDKMPAQEYSPIDFEHEERIGKYFKASLEEMVRVSTDPNSVG